MHYYQHHIGDFIRDTSRLTDNQAMAYLRLLWLYYDTEKPIPNKPQVLALKVGCDMESIQLLMESFFTLDGDDWRHGRCDKEIADYHAYIESQRAKGALGGRPRKTTGKPAALPQDGTGKPGVNPNREPLPTNQQPIDSVDKSTGVKTPLTADEIIFTYGLNLLTSAGVAEKHARSFLGGLRKSHGDDALVDALRECIRAKPLQPLEWLAKVLPPIGAPPKLNKQEALEARNREVVARMLAKEENHATE